MMLSSAARLKSLSRTSSIVSTGTHTIPSSHLIFTKGGVRGTGGVPWQHCYKRNELLNATYAISGRRQLHVTDNRRDGHEDEDDFDPDERPDPETALSSKLPPDFCGWNHDPDDEYKYAGRFEPPRFGFVHEIYLKEKGEPNVYEKLKVMLVQDRDEQNRRRRVWFTMLTHKPVAEERKLRWPIDANTTGQRVLLDILEGIYHTPLFPYHPEFHVTEKVDKEGRFFWRETLKEGELTDEDRYNRMNMSEKHKEDSARIGRWMVWKIHASRGLL